MKRIFTNAANLMKTTNTGRALETHAFNLGMGDVADLESAGLMARSNAAVAIMDNINGQKERDKRFEDLVYEQIRRSLNDIHAEIQFLDKQIKIEEKAIQANNTDIDFIRTLDDDNIMGADGKPREDVKALLKKYGYDDVDGMDAADIMLITQTIETDLHNDNIVRKGRIDDFQTRIGDLQDSVKRFQKNMPDNTPTNIKQQVTSISTHETYDVTYRAMKEAQADVIVEALAEVELQKTEAAVTSTFKPY